MQEQVVDSLPPYEEFSTLVYNQANQGQIAAGVTTENIAEIPVVQTVQEISEVSDVERIQEPCSINVLMNP